MLAAFNARTAKLGDLLAPRAMQSVRMRFRGVMHGLVCARLEDDSLPDRVARDVLIKPGDVLVVQP